ncbi:hypothetical protein P378_13305 [Desulforamulus profundi]|uniref:Uncharacterized protein n=1 Tax=Desulforamulus profundi TaxID=1383067 RepID=A0A2C6MF02_9FIRM|nr:hypothetical protein P378_13305 [Desulforamulus profundi]
MAGQAMTFSSRPSIPVINWGREIGLDGTEESVIYLSVVGKV